MKLLGVLVISFLTCFCAAAKADLLLAKGLLPLALPSLPVLDDPLGELVVRGTNNGTTPATLVLRIDDDLSVDYRRRVNEERMILPGAFELAFPARGMRRSNGNGFDLAKARRAFLFAAADVRAEILFRPPGSLPDGAIGYALGPDDAPVFPGFQPLGPLDPRIVSGRAAGIRRAGGPPLTGVGLVGGTIYRLPLANGRWRVTVWSEDPGEWETLPHPLNRRIRVNGNDIINYLWTPEEWTERRYLRLAHQEPLRMDSAWAAFGSLRGGRIDTVAQVNDDALTLELAGDGAASTFLAAILLQPDDGSPSVADRVDAERGRRFDEDWPVFGKPEPQQPTAAIVLAQGSGARIELMIPPGRHPIRLEHSGDITLTAYEGRWSLDRLHTGQNLLRPTTSHLVPLGTAISRNPTLPRRVVIWAKAGLSTNDGEFGGAVLLDDGSRVPFNGTVLPIRLPPTTMPVGTYLERAPHFDWFEREGRSGDAQVLCDLQRLAAFGLTAVAPPFPLPRSDAGAAYARYIESLESLGFTAPFLAYAPLKRLADEVGLAEAPSQLANLSATLGPDRMRQIAWSIADEPSNPVFGTDLAELAALIRGRVPGFQTAAHLNHPSDLRNLSGIDLALVNPGLPLQPAIFTELRKRGVEPWLYNMGNPRLAAGFWGIKTGARGYLQWHARMPTADPFDPTDGREGDVQFLYPSARPCPTEAAVHEDLLRLAEGIVDARWLIWAEKADRPLAARVRASVPDRWENANAMTDQILEGLRNEILKLAQGLR